MDDPSVDGVKYLESLLEGTHQTQQGGEANAARAMAEIHINILYRHTVEYHTLNQKRKKKQKALSRIEWHKKDFFLDLFLTPNLEL